MHCRREFIKVVGLTTGGAISGPVIGTCGSTGENRSLPSIYQSVISHLRPACSRMDWVGGAALKSVAGSNLLFRTLEVEVSSPVALAQAIGAIARACPADVHLVTVGNTVDLVSPGGHVLTIEHGLPGQNADRLSLKHSALRRPVNGSGRIQDPLRAIHPQGDCLLEAIRPSDGSGWADSFGLYLRGEVEKRLFNLEESRGWQQMATTLLQAAPADRSDAERIYAELLRTVPALAKLAGGDLIQEVLASPLVEQAARVVRKPASHTVVAQKDETSGKVATPGGDGCAWVVALLAPELRAGTAQALADSECHPFVRRTAMATYASARGAVHSGGPSRPWISSDRLLAGGVPSPSSIA